MNCALLPIQINNLWLKAHHKALLRDISVTIRENGITVIMGPNGAGKSLFIRCLHGLSQPDSGMINFAGTPLNSDIRRRQALIFQKPVLLKRTVQQNLAFVQRLRADILMADIEKVLEQVGLRHLASQPVKQLSGGEQQRLALARALLLQPEMLFLDEASANLDPASVGQIENVLLDARKKGQKIILITHDIAQAKRLADDIIFLHHGQLCEYSPADEFFTRPMSEQAKAYLDGQILI
jgi:tungstate transport system ATP-binding protein